jgi:diguanylate cyclase (GGDEF)-like protein
VGRHSRPGLVGRKLGRASKNETEVPCGAGTAADAPPVATRAPLTRHLAEDALTRLGGRPELLAAIAVAAENGPSSALVVIDLDRFLSYPLDEADDILLAVAGALEATATGRGSVFRTDRDEFAAVVESPSEESASAWASRALQSLGPIGASAAVVMIEPNTRPESALRDAELTMAALKEAGGGIVGAHGPHVDDWVRHRRHELDALAREVDELRMENDRLRQAMLIDPRSGLPNVAAFDADHAQVDSRWRRRADSYAVLLADIDHFDAFNEEFGSEAGLLALGAVSRTIGRTVRGGDRTYRLGDEEFAVLLPGSELREAVAAAERIRLRVEKLGIKHPGSPTGVLSVSIAAIAVGPRHKSAKDVLVELQDLLLAGTRMGRNRVIWPH